MAQCMYAFLGHRDDLHGIRYELLWIAGGKMVPWSGRSWAVSFLACMFLKTDFLVFSFTCPVGINVENLVFALQSSSRRQLWVGHLVAYLLLQLPIWRESEERMVGHGLYNLTLRSLTDGSLSSKVYSRLLSAQFRSGSLLIFQMTQNSLNH